MRKIIKNGLNIKVDMKFAEKASEEEAVPSFILIFVTISMIYSNTVNNKEGCS